MHPRLRISLSGILIAVCVWLVGVLSTRFLRHALHNGIREATVWQVDSPTTVDARFRSNVGPGAGLDVTHYWVFNITNVEEVRQGRKPRLVQLGPYSYQKTRIRVTAWWDREGRVAVQEYVYFTFLPDQSAGDPGADVVTTLNLPLIGVVEAIHGAQEAGAATQLVLDMLVSILQGSSDAQTDRLFMHRTVHELLWGYEDTLLVTLDRYLPRGTVPRTRFELVHNMTSVEEALKLPASIFDTGAFDPTHTWQRLTQNGWENATCWYCGPEAVRGSDGTQFAPGVQREDDSLRVWIPDLVRSVPLVYRDDVQLLGVNLLRFTLDPGMWWHLDPCHDQLQYHGLLNITSPTAVTPHGRRGAYAGPPIFAGAPHFCGCDEELARAVEGVECDEERSHTWIDVEPTTGITMRGIQRMMVSSQITPAGRQYLEPGIPVSSVIPIFWFESTNSMTEVQADMFRSLVYRVQYMIRYVPLWCGGTAAVVLLGALVWMLMWRPARQRRVAMGADDESANASAAHLEAGLTDGVLPSAVAGQQDLTEPLNGNAT